MKNLPSLKLEVGFLAMIGFALVYFVFYFLLYGTLPQCAINLSLPITIPITIFAIGAIGGTISSVVNKFRLRSIIARGR